MNDLVKFNGLTLEEINQEIERLEYAKQSAIIRKELEKEMALERYYAGFAKQRKGDAILPSVRKIISAQALGSNLGIFMNQSNLSFCNINTLENVDKIALDFQQYWIDKSKNHELVEALTSEDGINSIKNYIACEAMFARLEAHDLKDNNVALYIGLQAMARDNEKNTFAVFGKALNNWLKYMKKDIKNDGFSMNDRQLGKWEAYLEITLKEAKKQMAEDYVEKTNQLINLIRINDTSGNQLLISKEPK